MASAETSADAAAAVAERPASPRASPSPVAAAAAVPAPSASSAPSASASAPSSASSAAAASGPAPEASAPASSLHPPGSFSSTPVAPVVANNHHRRWRGEMGWTDLRRRGDGAASPGDGSRARENGRPSAPHRSRSPSQTSSKSDTSDEDIRVPRGADGAAATASNNGRRQSSPSFPYTSEARAYGTGQLSDHPASQDGRGASQRSRSRSRSPEDPSDRRGYQEAGRAASYVDRSRTPSPVARDVRILFKGREVFADDLIGLRVAKTFVGHGRFLGQVVKFDGPTSQYTVVYADGDAEDLSVESTIQILIQDEIERVDPSLPPPSNSFFVKREAVESAGVDSPNDAESSEVMSAGNQYRGQRPQSSGSAERRSAIRISDREAQFVIGLFENHALPILLQQGWRAQSNPSGGEARYVSPGVGDGFSSSGAVFRSALDVVEYIASDNELLTACFPTNVHAAILSLLPDPRRRQAAESSSGARKRGTADVPGMDPFANKRHRQPREDMYGGSSDTRRMAPTDASPRSEPAMSSHAYRAAELEYRMREREAAMRQGIASERFASAEAIPGRAGAAIPSTRHAYYSSAEYRVGHSRHPSGGSTTSSRWSGEPSVIPVSNKSMYHRRYEEPPRWREREAPARGGYYPPESSSVEAVPRGYARAERYYAGGYGGERTLTRPGYRSARGELPPEYRYQGMDDVPLGAAADPYRYRYADPPPHRGGFADGRQLDGSIELTAGRLPRDAASLSAGDSRVRRDSRAISMMDVDRLASSRAVARGDQSSSRSPRGESDAGAGYGAFRGQYATPRGYADGNGAAEIAPASNAPAPQDDERAV